MSKHTHQPCNFLTIKDKSRAEEAFKKAINLLYNGSQREMGRKVGVSYMSVNNWASLRNDIKPHVARYIEVVSRGEILACDLLGLTVKEQKKNQNNPVNYPVTLDLKECNFITEEDKLRSIKAFEELFALFPKKKDLAEFLSVSRSALDRWACHKAEIKPSFARLVEQKTEGKILAKDLLGC